MPRYFFDTSALVKHYHTELGSPKVDAILGEVGSEFWISRFDEVGVEPSQSSEKVHFLCISDGDHLIPADEARIFADSSQM